MKKFILSALLLTAGLSYGQNYNFPVGLFNYETYKEGTKNSSIANAFKVSGSNILVKKAKYGVLVKYLGDCTDLNLFDNKGEKVEDVKFDAKNKGLIMYAKPTNEEYYLEVVTSKSKQSFYHKLVL